MKSIFLIHLLLSLFLHAEELPILKEFPSSNDPGEFRREVVEYIVYSSKIGLSVDRDSSILRQKIKTDPKDWEAPVAEIISDPRKYMSSTEMALSAAVIRKSKNDPRISVATARLFNEFVPMSIELFDQRPDDAGLRDGINSWVLNLITQIVELDSPEALQPILEFLHSPEVDRFNTLQSYEPKYVASALQKFGDLRNAEEALKVAAKLKSIGRADVATDFRRASERIKKEAAQKQATSTGESNGSSKDAPGSNDDGKGDPDGSPLWPWLAAGGVLIVALGAYFRMKRSEV